MGSNEPLAALLSDLHCTLERLSVTLSTSNGSSFPVPSFAAPKINHIPSLPQPTDPRSSVASQPAPPPSFTDILRSAILSQPATSKPRAPTFAALRIPPHANRVNLENQKPVKSVSIKLAKMRSLSEKGILVCYHCGDQGHYTKYCRNSLTCYKCSKVGHKFNSCPLSRSSPSLLPPHLSTFLIRYCSTATSPYSFSYSTAPYSTPRFTDHHYASATDCYS